MTGTRTLRRGAAAAVATSALATVLLGAGTGVAAAAVDPTLGYDAVADKGSLYNVAEVIGAHAAYKAGYTGKGVGVALIDTGVAPVQGLTSGNVVNGPDLSLDNPMTSLVSNDGFGHGTHMAGIIAGNDGTTTGFKGVAPGAKLLSV